MRLTENYNPAKFGEYVGLSGYFVSFCLKTRKCLFTIYDTLKKKQNNQIQSFISLSPCSNFRGLRMTEQQVVWVLHLYRQTKFFPRVSFRAFYNTTHFSILFYLLKTSPCKKIVLEQSKITEDNHVKFHVNLFLSSQGIGLWGLIQPLQLTKLLHWLLQPLDTIQKNQCKEQKVTFSTCVNYLSNQDGIANASTPRNKATNCY